MNDCLARGDIYFCDLGENNRSIQGGYRPVLVIQATQITNQTSTVLVAPITTQIKRTDLSSHLILGDRCGLDKTSMVLFEQIRPVNIDDLKSFVGRITLSEQWRMITKSLKKTFGLWHYPKPKNGDVRCLCNKHLNEYKNMPTYIIRRFQPTQDIRDKCDKCDNLGYDYVLFERKNVLRKKVYSYGK